MATVLTSFFQSVDAMDNAFIKEFKKKYKGDTIIIAVEADMENLNDDQLKILESDSLIVNNGAETFKVVGGLEPKKGKPGGPQSMIDPGIGQ